MRIIGREHCEYRTEELVESGGCLYHRALNGGTRGAHSTGGNHFPTSLEPTREVSESEARALLLDWGYDPDDCLDDGP
jgi:hypothetical protein